MDTLMRMERAVRLLLDHDKNLTARQMLIFLEVARATDGVEEAWIERRLGVRHREVELAMHHFAHVDGPGVQTASHSLVVVRDPPGDRRRHVAYLTEEGRRLARDLRACLQGG